MNEDLKEARESIVRAVSSAAKELEEEMSLKDYLVMISRRIVKEAGDAILSIHGEKLEEALRHLEEAEALLREAMDKVGSSIKYMHQGPLVHAIQEYVEALVFLKLTKGLDVPTHKDLRIPVQPFIYGLAEVAGEVRRRVLDLLRKDDVDEAARWLEVLEDLYGALRGLELYRGVIDDIKWRVDSVRKTLEATRGDLTLAIQRKRMRDDMRRLEEKLRGIGTW